MTSLDHSPDAERGQQRERHHPEALLGDPVPLERARYRETQQERRQDGVAGGLFAEPPSAPAARRTRP
ncbi:MAG TPA: hypothetical protein VFY84_20710 [Jiangellales bacterium]|nr:hypothetical protein [Jiangellales bacterium]